MMAKYEGSPLLLFQAINEVASAGCLAPGAQPTHHPFWTCLLQQAGIISTCSQTHSGELLLSAKHIYSLVNFRIVCLLQVARKLAVVKTSNSCVSLTYFIVRNPTEVGRKRTLWQSTPLFQDNWTGCTWFCAGGWQLEKKETPSSKLLGCFRFAWLAESLLQLDLRPVFLPCEEKVPESPLPFPGRADFSRLIYGSTHATL